MTHHDDDPAVVVTVVRSGGIAGLRRQWRVQPDLEHRSEWERLVEACPWGDAASGPAGPGHSAGSGDPAGSRESAGPALGPDRDRYVWAIDAVLLDDHHHATMSDREVIGPWRDLVDRVRQENRRSDADSPRRHGRDDD